MEKRGMAGAARSWWALRKRLRRRWSWRRVMATASSETDHSGNLEVGGRLLGADLRPALGVPDLETAASADEYHVALELEGGALLLGQQDAAVAVGGDGAGLAVKCRIAFRCSTAGMPLCLMLASTESNSSGGITIRKSPPGCGMAWNSSEPPSSHEAGIVTRFFASMDLSKVPA